MCVGHGTVCVWLGYAGGWPPQAGEGGELASQGTGGPQSSPCLLSEVSARAPRLDLNIIPNTPERSVNNSFIQGKFQEILNFAGLVFFLVEGAFERPAALQALVKWNKSIEI